MLHPAEYLPELTLIPDIIIDWPKRMVHQHSHPVTKKPKNRLQLSFSECLACWGDSSVLEDPVLPELTSVEGQSAWIATTLAPAYPELTWEDSEGFNAPLNSQRLADVAQNKNITNLYHMVQAMLKQRFIIEDPREPMYWQGWWVLHMGLHLLEQPNMNVSLEQCQAFLSLVRLGNIDVAYTYEVLRYITDPNSEVIVSQIDTVKFTSPNYECDLRSLNAAAKLVFHPAQPLANQAWFATLLALNTQSLRFAEQNQLLDFSLEAKSDIDESLAAFIDAVVAEFDLVEELRHLIGSMDEKAKLYLKIIARHFVLFKQMPDKSLLDSICLHQPHFDVVEKIYKAWPEHMKSPILMQTTLKANLSTAKLNLLVKLFEQGATASLTEAHIQSLKHLRHDDVETLQQQSPAEIIVQFEAGIEQRMQLAQQRQEGTALAELVNRR